MKIAPYTALTSSDKFFFKLSKVKSKTIDLVSVAKALTIKVLPPPLGP